jgi:hypothetical protein
LSDTFVLFDDRNLVASAGLVPVLALALAGIAHNLTHAAGCLASRFHATARPSTIRDQLIRHPGPDCHLRPTTHPAPAHRLALGTPLVGLIAAVT